VSCNQPVPLAPRPKPPQVGYPIDWSKTNGTFTVKDVYAGPGVEGIARGTVKKLRVVAVENRPTYTYSAPMDQRGDREFDKYIA
jgi:hypothetical protein